MKLCSKLITLSRTSRRTLAGLQKRPIFLSAVSLNVCLAASARLPEVTDEDSFANLRSQISGLASASKFWYMVGLCISEHTFVCFCHLRWQMHAWSEPSYKRWLRSSESAPASFVWFSKSMCIVSNLIARGYGAPWMVAWFKTMQSMAGFDGSDSERWFTSEHGAGSTAWGKKVANAIFSRAFLHCFVHVHGRIQTSVIRGTAFKRSLDKQQWPQQACIIQMPVWPFRICRLISIPCNSG